MIFTVHIPSQGSTYYLLNACILSALEASKKGAKRGTSMHLRRHTCVHWWSSFACPFFPAQDWTTCSDWWLWLWRGCREQGWTWWVRSWPSFVRGATLRADTPSRLLIFPQKNLELNESSLLEKCIKWKKALSFFPSRLLPPSEITLIFSALLERYGVFVETPCDT